MATQGKKIIDQSPVYGYNIIGGSKKRKKNSSWKLNHVLQNRNRNQKFIYKLR